MVLPILHRDPGKWTKTHCPRENIFDIHRQLPRDKEFLKRRSLKDSCGFRVGSSVDARMYVDGSIGGSDVMMVAFSMGFGSRGRPQASVIPASRFADSRAGGIVEHIPAGRVEDSSVGGCGERPSGEWSMVDHYRCDEHIRVEVDLQMKVSRYIYAVCFAEG